MIPTLIDQDVHGFGPNSGEVFDSLKKALEAGSGTDAANFVGGRALIPESLETSLYTVLHSVANTPLIRLLKQEPVRSPVHQWSNKTEVGVDEGVFAAENQAGVGSDSTYARVTAQMAYMQTLREVTLQAKMANMITDPVAEETVSGILLLLRVAEIAMYTGDRNINPFQFDGLRKLTPSTNVRDMRGQRADSAAFEEELSEISRLVFEQFGEITNSFLSTTTLADFIKVINSRIRYPIQQTAEGDVVYGNAKFSKYVTPFSTFQVTGDVFNRDKTIPKPSALTTTRPDALDLPGGGALSLDVGTTQFFTGDLGAYFYKGSAVNEFGESDPLALTSITVTATNRVKITLEYSGSNVIRAIRIFRSNKDASDDTNVKESRTYGIGTADVTGVGTGGDPFILFDINDELPGTSTAYMLDASPTSRAIDWLSFLPAIKFQLYPSNKPVEPFLVLQFGALGDKIPQRHGIIKNINTSRNTGFSFSGEAA